MYIALCEIGLVGDSPENSGMSRVPLLLFSFVLSCSLVVALIFFVGWSCYLVCTNQTSIEVQINNEEMKRDPLFVNPYDLGSRRLNVQSVFGEYKSSWKLLIPRWR